MLLLFISLLCFQSTYAQMNLSPFVELLKPESMNRFAEIAGELSSLAASSMAKNERDVQKTVTQDREVPIGPDSRPSEVLGQAFSNLASQSRGMFLGALAPFEKTTTAPETAATEAPEITTALPHHGLTIRSLVPSRPEKRYTKDVFSLTAPTEPPPSSTTSAPELRRAEAAKAFGTGLVPIETAVAAERATPAEVPAVQPNPLLQLANTFLRGTAGSQDAATQGVATSQGGQLPSIGIKDIVPGANQNFGIPKGQGCFPFLSEFMQVAYGNCQQVADEGAWDAWGNELKSAILTGQIDLLRASQETCRRGAERQQCAALRKAISTCDILASLQIGGQLQRAMKRCEEVGGLVDQNPMVILSQINGLIGGEVAQGFFNKFLGT